MEIAGEKEEEKEQYAESSHTLVFLSFISAILDTHQDLWVIHGLNTTLALTELENWLEGP